MTQVEDQRSGSPNRRAPTDERRRYNRRTTSGTEPSPPYFEVFERIAAALESISAALTAPPEQGARAPDPRSGTPEPQRD